jgi:dihydroflavonol-4-reductase
MAIRLSPRQAPAVHPQSDDLRHAFVTGGTGFIGANLVEALNRRGIGVRLLHRPSSSMQTLAGLHFEPVAGDILDSPDKLAGLIDGCDWIFHVAAVSDYWRQKVDRVYHVNVQGTKNVLAAAQRVPIERFVFCSSVGSMLPPQGGKPINEQNKFGLKPGLFPYGHSKYLAEREVLSAVANGLPALIVNPTVVIGPRDINEISGSFVVEATKGKMRVVFPAGMNMVAVEDVVNGMIAAAEKGRIGERYILAGTNLSLWQAAKTITRITGSPGPWLMLPRASLPLIATFVAVLRKLVGNRMPLDANQVRVGAMNQYVDGRKAAEAFGLAATPVETAVRSAYRWYREQGIVK